MLATLERWSRFPVPPSVSIDIRETVGRYGRLVIERNDEGELMLHGDRCRGADRSVAQQAHPAAADRPPHSAVVRDRRVGARAHQAGAAEDRLAGRRPRRVHAGHAASDRARRDELVAASVPAQGRRHLHRRRLGRRRAPLRRRQDPRRRRRDGRHEDDDAHPRDEHGQRAPVARRAPQAHVARPPRRSASTRGR